MKVGWELIEIGPQALIPGKFTSDQSHPDVDQHGRDHLGIHLALDIF